jgi:hypothetical protein
VCLVTEGEQVTLSSCGRKWRFTAAARPLLDLLVSGREYRISDLESVSDLPPSVVREFARELVANGLLNIL